MSVVKSKRTESKLEVLLRAYELAGYTAKICTTEKNFPKRYRWCVTNKIVEKAIEINTYCEEANAIYVKTHSDYKQRRYLQNQALSCTYSLLSIIQLADEIFNLPSDKLDHWTGLVVHEQILIRAWKHNDEERYKNI